MLHTLDEEGDVPLTPADSRVQYADPGYLLYVLDGMLVAHPFDADKGDLTGDPMPLADNIGSSAVGLADFSASANGTFSFRSGEVGWAAVAVVRSRREGDGLPCRGQRVPEFPICRRMENAL